MTEPPVVFLHGWGGSARGTWHAFGLPGRLERAGRECLVLDLPGHGPAGGSHDSRAYDAIVELVDAQLPDAGALDVVGFSLGGKIALALEVRRPGRFRRMVIAGVGANIFTPEPSGSALREVLLRGIGHDVPAAVRGSAVYALQSGGDPGAMAACLTRDWVAPSQQQLRTMRAEVMLVNGDEDTMIRSAHPLAKCLPNARVETLAGIDHFSTPYSRRLHELAEAFLSERAAAEMTNTYRGEAALAARKES